MRKKPPVPFSHKFPHVDPPALRLLEQLLAFDPKYRPSAEQVELNKCDCYCLIYQWPIWPGQSFDGSQKCFGVDLFEKVPTASLKSRQLQMYGLFLLWPRGLFWLTSTSKAHDFWEAIPKVRPRRLSIMWEISTYNDIGFSNFSADAGFLYFMSLSGFSWPIFRRAC